VPWGLSLGAEPPQSPEPAAPSSLPVPACLPDGQGFLRARLQGALDVELEWANEGTDCTGAMRPDGGVRLGFSRAIYDDGQRLVLLFGIAGLKEGATAHILPVNVTIIRQGTGQFFGTKGDDKCTLDEVRQEPVTGIPFRNRTYRVIARGFCTQPARSLSDDGAVLITRFDFAGRVDFSEADLGDDLSAPSPTRPSSL
jgi:hypothetical protein